ncbi:response regulator transcription factor [Thiomicrospira sp. ALE5]|uniref:response regulator transcription factor n=1 Tax=Thiomicrospira sp. ALE5 TaxID=748650 RepID=UPI0008EB1662|nr:response regulator transcription factor [Thiomicrospira sp. ALE5]SFR60747.1 two-component system, OmpR family, response regulator [Thiomicrospira sp. ALE5]
MKLQDSPASKLTLLLIEDEEDLAYQLQRFLIKRGYAVQISFEIKDSLALIKEQSFDAVLFDRLLPDGDALEVVNEIKDHHAGLLLIMSALGRVKDRVAGFKKDVDYYLPKPVDLDELLAILEHYERTKQSHATDENLSAQMKWSLVSSQLICPAGIQITLTAREAIMVALLIDHAGSLVSKEMLINALNKNYDAYDPKALDSAIYRIRSKVDAAAQHALPLETVHGLGYVWQV